MQDVLHVTERQGNIYSPPSEEALRRSNNVQKLGFLINVITVFGLIIIIAIGSAIFDAVKHVKPTCNSVTTVYESLGFPGYEGFSWNDVLTQAKGSSVNFWSWDGSDDTNSWIDNWLAVKVKALYQIDLQRIPIDATVYAVKQIARERALGYGINEGSVDLVWINGENFYNASLAGNLYGPWSQKTPNAVNFDWSSTAIAYDFGHPTNGYEVFIININYVIISNKMEYKLFMSFIFHFLHSYVCLFI